MNDDAGRHWVYLKLKINHDRFKFNNLDFFFNGLMLQEVYPLLYNVFPSSKSGKMTPGT